MKRIKKRIRYRTYLNFRTLPIAALLALSPFFAGEAVFADAPEAAASEAKSDSGSTGAVREPTVFEVEKQEKIRERQKAMDDINAFLIESYKFKLDKLLDEVYRSVRVASKDDPKLQTVLLRRILREIEGKIAVANEKPITPNRKKILVSVFTYLKSEIESKIRAFESE